MKLLTKEQIRAWDQYTIRRREISSFQLMKEASDVFCKWFSSRFESLASPIYIFCGPGNNGGDGLCVTALLREQGYQVKTYLCTFGSRVSNDNFLAQSICKEFEMLDLKSFPIIPKNAIIIDALFGSGIKGALRPKYEETVRNINSSECHIVSVDIPSGLDPDAFNSNLTINSDYCLSFEIPKISFFYHENSHRVKNWSFQSIGLIDVFLKETESSNYFISRKLVEKSFRKRSKISSKVSFGFGQLSGGSRGMFGAAILAARAAMRGGIGRLVVNLPEDYVAPLITAIPEVMSGTPFKEDLDQTFEVANKHVNAFAIGPGLGNSTSANFYLDSFLELGLSNCILDADALNIIARQNWQNRLAPKSIITPHQYEFERLFGKSKNHYERIRLQRRAAKELDIFIILKGHYTTICTPSGDCYYNASGNVGMATAGSGDVLTGILLSFLAQGYNQLETCYLGVFCHGFAGDKACKQFGEVSMIASDIIAFIPQTLKELYGEE